MVYLTVDLFQDFQCIADACPNTCCAGWRILIDAETHKKMAEHEKELGVPAHEWLIENDGSIQAKLKHNRCYMLNHDNLCEVVLKLGPQYLSNVCSQYPRVFAQYGNVTECFLTMSCPVVIVRLMKQENVLFSFDETDENVPNYPYNRLYLFESAIRSSIVDIIQNTSGITLGTKLFVSYRILNEAVKSFQQNQIDFHLFKSRTDVNSYFQKNTLSSFNAALQNLVDESKRYVFLQRLISVLYQETPHVHFAELLQQAIAYFASAPAETYLADLVSFRAFIKPYGAFYRNYWVYHIFMELVKIPDYKLAQEGMLYIAAEFCLIQTLALTAYASRQKLEQEEYIYIVSVISRIMEHNQNFRKNLIAELHKNQLISAAGLLLMIID